MTYLYTTKTYLYIVNILLEHPPRLFPHCLCVNLTSYHLQAMHVACAKVVLRDQQHVRYWIQWIHDATGSIGYMLQLNYPIQASVKVICSMIESKILGRGITELACT